MHHTPVDVAAEIILKYIEKLQSLKYEDIPHKFCLNNLTCHCGVRLRDIIKWKERPMCWYKQIAIFEENS